MEIPPNPTEEHEDSHVKYTGQVTDNNESDMDVEKSAPPWHKYANSIKTGGCTLVVLVLLFGLIAIANVFGFAEEKNVCQCANGQARACGSSPANRDIDVKKSQGNLLDNEFNNIGVALNGYDVVQYSMQLPELAGVLGCPEFNANLTSRVSTVDNKYETFTFWFASPENRDKFKASPWQFVPRYGGFGAYRIARENSAYSQGWSARALGPPSDPVNLWARFNQTLYLFSAPEDLAAFLRNPEEITSRADAQWIAWYGSLQAGPLNEQCFAQTWKCCRQCNPPTSKAAVFQQVPVPSNASLQCQPADDGVSCR